MFRSIIAIAALMVCSGAWAKPPASEGWNRVDFICTDLDTGRQRREWFYANENAGHFDYEERYRDSDIVRVYHWSDDLELGKNVFGPKGEVTGVYRIDRATGRLSDSYRARDRRIFLDCELRPENKF